jgi:hypothetical protein
MLSLTFLATKATRKAPPPPPPPPPVFEPPPGAEQETASRMRDVNAQKDLHIRRVVSFFMKAPFFPDTNFLMIEALTQSNHNFGQFARIIHSCATLMIL